MTFEQSKDYGHMSDEMLMELVSAGDKEAFGQLYQNTDKTIYSYLLSIARSPQDAEELMQETYLKVWTSAAGYRAQGKPLAWMFTIARNLCYMRFRDQRRESELGLDELSDRVVLHAALRILKEDERQIVLLHTAAGLKHREIASSLQMPLATVLSKYNRAMKKLQAHLREEGGYR